MQSQICFPPLLVAVEWLLTICAIGGCLVVGRLFDLHFHCYPSGAFPPPCPATLPDNIGDADHVGRNLQEHSQVGDQLVPKELILCHGWEVEGDEQHWRCSDLDRGRASEEDMHHFIIRIEEIGAVHAIKCGDELS